MGEYVTIGQGPNSAFRGYLARPASLPAPTVVVLQELFGVNADMRQTCDELAADGFIALCPDLFWRQRPGVDLNVRSPEDWITGLALYTAFDRDRGVGDVVCAMDAAARLEGGTGKVGLLGYCMGALLAFMTAARSRVDAAVCFHGADTEKYLDEASAISSPMMLHLAGEDEFMPRAARNAITATLGWRPEIQVFCYEGCHHAFTRHNGLHYEAGAARLAIARTRRFLHDAIEAWPSKPAVHTSDTGDHDAHA